MSTQLNVRLPEPTVSEINELARVYGSQAKVIIAAVSKLSEELKERKMATTVITAKKNAGGEWVLVDGNGNEAQEGYGYATKKEAMEAAEQIWPSNSVWEGKRTLTGWRIKTD